MPSFDYAAIDAAGRTRTGRITGTGLADARAALEKRGLVPTRVEPAQTRTTGKAAAATAREKRIGGKTLALLTRQLAMLAAVAPMEEALRTLRDQTEQPRIRRILDATHAGVVEGLPLSEAMGRVGAAFPVNYRAMVASGEGSSALPAVLVRLANMLERQQDVNAKVTSALVYPLVLAVVALAVIIALMTLVVPRVVDQFNTSGQKLPALTEGVIALSRLMTQWGWLIALVLIGAGFLASWLLRRPGPRLAADRALRRVPLVGPMIRDVEASSFARSLSTMIGSGLPAYEALLMAARTSGGALTREAAAKMAVWVSEGSGLSAAMRRADAFPPLLVYLTASGESGGRLAEMLESAADYMEREFRTATSVALSLLEPLIIVFMGGVVCLVILSILLPILQINAMAIG